MTFEEKIDMLKDDFPSTKLILDDLYKNNEYEDYKDKAWELFKKTYDNANQINGIIITEKNKKENEEMKEFIKVKTGINL